MTGPLFAGIDGGGTKTVVVVVDETGRELHRIQTTTSNAAVVGHDAAGTILRAALESALQGVPPATAFEKAWFGLSGSDRPEDHRLLKPYVLDLASDIRMTNDAELVLGALRDAVGVAVVSGTGSIAFGRNAQGVRIRSGGWGQIIGDEGSGYDLARRMFDAFAREADGRGPATSLSTRLTSHFGLANPHQLITFVYSPETSKGDIAGLSRFVVEEANAGDAIALSIIAASAGELAETVAAAARRLGFVSSLPLALTGSLLVHNDRFRHLVLATLRREWPTLDTQIVDDPALTAARALAATYHTESG